MGCEPFVLCLSKHDRLTAYSPVGWLPKLRSPFDKLRVNGVLGGPTDFFMFIHSGQMNLPLQRLGSSLIQFVTMLQFCKKLLHINHSPRKIISNLATAYSIQRLLLPKESNRLGSIISVP